MTRVIEKIPVFHQLVRPESLTCPILHNGGTAWTCIFYCGIPRLGEDISAHNDNVYSLVFAIFLDIFIYMQSRPHRKTAIHHWGGPFEYQTTIKRDQKGIFYI